jgi:hypothetical protein
VFIHRVWEDNFAKDGIVVHEDYNKDCFMAYLFPRRQQNRKFKSSMMMHSCNRTLVEREVQRILDNTKYDDGKNKAAMREAMRINFL